MPRPPRWLHNQRLLPPRRHRGIVATAPDESSPRHLPSTGKVSPRSLACLSNASHPIYAFLQPSTQKIPSDCHENCLSLSLLRRSRLKGKKKKEKKLTARMAFSLPRLLTTRDENLTLHKHLLTFSAGPRSCIGRELAMASKSPPPPPPFPFLTYP